METARQQDSKTARQRDGKPPGLSVLISIVSSLPGNDPQEAHRVIDEKPAIRLAGDA